MERIAVVDLTTDSGGDATAFSRIVNEMSDRSGTSKTTMRPASTSRSPVRRPASHEELGVASLFARAGEPVKRPIPIVNERINIVIANGGDTKTGSFHIVIDGWTQENDFTLS